MLGHFFSVSVLFSLPKWFGQDVKAKLARLQSQRQSHLFFLMYVILYACISTHESDLACVFEMRHSLTWYLERT